MIAGVGIDFVRISRVQAIIQKYGLSRLGQRIFSPRESTHLLNLRSATQSQSSQHIAGRIAAKEAIFKSLSGKRRLGWREIEVVTIPNQNGRNLREGPQVTLPHDLGNKYQVLLSISHDGDYAIAMAITAIVPS